jgi:selenide,water dikinase
MLRASGVSALLSLSSVPVLPGATELLEQGVAPGGTHRNQAGVEDYVNWDDSLTDNDKLLLCDAQTSGGLLISVPEERLSLLLGALEERGVSTREVLGTIIEGNPGHAKVRP